MFAPLYARRGCLISYPRPAYKSHYAKYGQQGGGRCPLLALRVLVPRVFCLPWLLLRLSSPPTPQRCAPSALRAHPPRFATLRAKPCGPKPLRDDSGPVVLCFRRARPPPQGARSARSVFQTASRYFRCARSMPRGRPRPASGAGGSTRPPGSRSENMLYNIFPELYMCRENRKLVLIIKGKRPPGEAAAVT